MKSIGSILLALVMVIVVFVFASIVDILAVFLYPRFYSNAAFIVIFGVAGIFAGVLGTMNGIEKDVGKKDSVRWSVILLLFLSGLGFFFLLARLEGGEYKSAFQSFGVTLALSVLPFAKSKTAW